MLQHIEEIEKEVQQDDSAHIGEKMFLYGLIRALQPNVVVETGTHRGKTSLYMAEALFDNGKGELHTCDPFEWGAKGNFRKIPDLEKLITYYSIEGRDLDIDNIDFLFVDGYHETEIVMQEMKALLPKLTEHAVVVFHDCLYERPETENVNKACELLGLKTVWLPTFNGLRIYEHSER